MPRYRLVVTHAPSADAKRVVTILRGIPKWVDSPSLVRVVQNDRDETFAFGGVPIASHDFEGELRKVRTHLEGFGIRCEITAEPGFGAWAAWLGRVTVGRLPELPIASERGLRFVIQAARGMRVAKLVFLAVMLFLPGLLALRSMKQLRSAQQPTFAQAAPLPSSVASDFAADDELPDDDSDDLAPGSPSGAASVHVRVTAEDDPDDPLDDPGESESDDRARAALAAQVPLADVDAGAIEDAASANDARTPSDAGSDAGIALAATRGAPPADVASLVAATTGRVVARTEIVSALAGFMLGCALAAVAVAFAGARDLGAAARYRAQRWLIAVAAGGTIVGSAAVREATLLVPHAPPTFGAVTTPPRPPKRAPSPSPSIVASALPPVASASTMASSSTSPSASARAGVAPSALPSSSAARPAPSASIVAAPSARSSASAAPALANPPASPAPAPSVAIAAPSASISESHAAPDPPSTPPIPIGHAPVVFGAIAFVIGLLGGGAGFPFLARRQARRAP